MMTHAIDLSTQPIQPLPKEINLNQEKVSLGYKLFNDKRLSKDNTISCATCHDLSSGGADKTQFSRGINNALGGRNSPTVYNSGLNFRQLWDGRARDLFTQVGGALTNAKVMGSTWDEVIKKLSKNEAYQESFSRIYGTDVTEEAIRDAVAEFEKSLITVDSPFDRYLYGDENAISEREKRGYKLFVSYGCSSCHQGRNVGGNMFQRFGVLKDIRLRKGGNEGDLGRFKVTSDEEDKYVFRVPSLRLVVITPPYFHDGSVETLEGAVDVMIEFQLGRKVPEKDRDDIIAFLRSLVGKHKLLNHD